MSSSFPATDFPVPSLRQGNEPAHAVHRDTSAVRGTEEPSDEALIARVCADDSDALGLLFRRYARLVWTIAHRILRNSEEADDLLQDLFLLVRRKASVFDSSKGSVRSLLIQMSYQRSFSRRRDLGRQNFYCADEVIERPTVAKGSPFVPFYDKSLEARVGKAALQKALEDLSVEQRGTLQLCFFEGHTLEEVAVLLGQSYGNVRHHYYRGLAKLRKHWQGSV
jgi:RNA polymerase sigma-70 factor, ECF subfamily